MTQQEFEMSKNLLKDVITKQTGSLSKAVKELVQNSRDAGSTTITIEVSENQLTVDDNGKGMTPKDIEEFFKVFGATAKRGNKDVDGRFGMGRGQIMNFGLTTWNTLKSKITVDIRKFLGYDLKTLKANKRGCKVVCKFYGIQDWWARRNVTMMLERDLLPTKNITLSINGKTLNPEIKMIEQFTDETFDIFTSSVITHRIYCRGLSVNSFESNFTYNVNVKEKAELNFARNEFLETDPLYDKIKAKMNEVEELMTITKDHFDNREARQTLQFIKDGRVALESVINKPIVRTATDKKLSISQLIGKEVMFGGCNIWSDDCINRGHIVLHKDNEYLIEMLINKLGLDITISDKKPKDVAKRGYHREFEVDKLRKNKIYGVVPNDMNKYIFNPLGEDYQRDVYLGSSDVADGWTDGSTEIHVDKNLIETSRNKEEIFMRVWHNLCHEYSHDKNTEKKDYHSEEFYENYHNLTKLTIKKIAEYVKMVSAKRLKELYF